MEQITAPLPVLDTVIEHSKPVEFIRSPALPVPTDPARAWLLLNEIQVPSDAPLHSLFGNEGRTAIDLLRSRLLRELRRSDMTKLALTSPRHGCGTAALASQLALSFARQADLKIMLMDLDLRDPRIARVFGLSQEAPLRSLLSGVRREFDSTCMRVGQNLALSLATQPTDDPSELLATAQSRDLVAQIEREFQPDVLLINLPPVLGQDDVIAAADLYDAALLVTAADHTMIRDADQAETLISEQKPCLGVVLNTCRFHDAHAPS